MVLNIARILASIALFFGTANGICPLCATPADLPKRWTYVLPSGQTCQELYIELGWISDPDDSRCIEAKQQSEVLCCGDEEPDPIVFPPTSPPVYNGPVGNEPICPICGTDEYPGIPSAFIVARYVGDYTCDQLFYRGNYGLIPGFMCGPLQDFAEPVCGCGRYNPACQRDPTKCHGYVAPPTPQPVQPTPPPPPVPFPTPPPVPAPSLPPVATPVPAPSLFDRKTPRKTGKFNAKISGTSGGAAGRLRGNRNLEEDNMEIPEVN